MKKTICIMSVLAVVVAAISFLLKQNDVTGFNNEAKALRGCVNGPSNSRYCNFENGDYECKEYWIWNCLSTYQD